ncbi:MAG TPA: hypothetical protein VFT12_14130, partial [Thermoanaerobaculia bacterium]|nr:hypothetical protein [Thermoanaerobaculia bacterium]
MISTIWSALRTRASVPVRAGENDADRKVSEPFGKRGEQPVHRQMPLPRLALANDVRHFDDLDHRHGCAPPQDVGQHAFLITRQMPPN